MSVATALAWVLERHEPDGGAPPLFGEGPVIVWAPEPDPAPLLVLQRHGTPRDLEIVVTFKPDAEVLAASGLTTVCEPTLTEAAGAVVVVTRHREQTLVHLADALARTRPGGAILVAGANALGASWYEGRLEDAGFELEVESKAKCRVARLRRPAVLPPLVSEWAALAVPTEIDGTPLATCPGHFSAGRIDPGSALLAKVVPPLSGQVGDFGCGWGFLTWSVLQKGRELTALHLVDADASVLRLAEDRLRAPVAAAGLPLTATWADCRKRPPGLPLLHAIVTNPPFHQGDRQTLSVGLEFVTAAADALRQNGRLYLVALRNLPYEDALNAAFGTVRMAADDGAYRVWDARDPIPEKARAARLERQKRPR
ncbi:MAG: class I SAM-dependent methyltransferase [Myxococcales bacterium]|nr:class I SAM-dependent methyltransferase [Myxococcales bacterium]